MHAHIHTLLRATHSGGLDCLVATNSAMAGDMLTSRSARVASGSMELWRCNKGQTKSIDLKCNDMQEYSYLQWALD